MQVANALAIWLAVDDGLVNGNLDGADLLFLLAFVLALVAAVISGVQRSVVGALGWGAVALLGLAWMVL